MSGFADKVWLPSSNIGIFSLERKYANNQNTISINSTNSIDCRSRNATLFNLNDSLGNIKIKSEPIDPAEFDEYGCIDRNPFLSHLFYSTETDYLDRSDFDLANPIKVKCCIENSVIQDSTEYGRRGQKETFFTPEDEFCERRLFSSPKLEEVEYLGVKPSFLDSPVSENNDYYNLKPVVVDLTGIELPVKSVSLLNTLNGKTSLGEPMCSSSIKTEVNEDAYSNSKNSIFELNEQKLYDISEIVPVEEFLPNQFMETVKQETQDNHAENETKQVKSKGRKTRKKKRKKSNLLKKNNAKNTSRKITISKTITEKTKEKNKTNGDCTKENNGTKVTENKQYWWNALQRYNFRPRDKLKNNSIQTQEDILNEMLGFESDSTTEDNVIGSFGMRRKKHTSQDKTKNTFNRFFVKEEMKKELDLEESEFSIDKQRKPQAKRGRKKKENAMQESKDSVEFANASPYQSFQEKQHHMKANAKTPIIPCKKEYNNKEVKPTLKTDFKWCPNINYDYFNHENGSNNKISYCTRSRTAHEGSYKSTSNYFEDYEVNWDQFTFSNSVDTIMANPKFMKDDSFIDKSDKYSNTFIVNCEEDYDGKTMKIFSNKKFKCDECIYSSDRRSKIEQHKLKHAMGMEYRCHFCHFVSSYNREFYRHMETHYEGPPYRCEHAQCSYVSCRISTLLVHCVMHSNVRGYKCHLCSYSCKRKYHLKGHMVTHSVEKQFLCSFCQKKYKHKCSLVRHLLRHEDRVKYKY